MRVLTLVLLVCLLVTLGPLVSIWATNVLLCGHWVIPYTFKTWFAILLVGGLFKFGIVQTKERR